MRREHAIECTEHVLRACATEEHHAWGSGGARTVLVMPPSAILWATECAVGTSRTLSRWRSDCNPILRLRERNTVGFLSTILLPSSPNSRISDACGKKNARVALHCVGFVHFFFYSSRADLQKRCASLRSVLSAGPPPDRRRRVHARAEGRRAHCRRPRGALRRLHHRNRGLLHLRGSRVLHYEFFQSFHAIFRFFHVKKLKKRYTF